MTEASAARFTAAPDAPKGLGPVTRARLRRTYAIYGAFALIGLAPWLMGADASLKAIGAGLWVPGAGFLAVGGWAALLFPLALAVFVFSLIAWFWSGMVLAPVFVWLGSALIAGAMAKSGASPVGAGLGAASALLITLGFQRRNARLRREALARGEARKTFVARSLAEVQARPLAADATAREIRGEDLPALRYLLDRALQPIDGFGGFDVIEQFQPAALRYQINHMGFALAIVQGACTPNFHGYLGLAQRNLIDKYRLRKVWGYWIYESCWGHLNFTNWDPAAKDNIMLTGWYGMHVGAYMLNSGDRRYLEPGTLSFRQDARTVYRHDFNTIIGSVTWNYDRAEFGLFACEPNWIYPICNHYGMASLAVHDAVCGGDKVRTYLPRWTEMLDTEFTDEGGSIIGLKSQHTGFTVPFPVSELGYAPFENAFAPERARRLWAIARKEIEPAVARDETGKLRVFLPGAGLDTGNYRASHAYAYAAILVGAREFGEHDLAEAAQNSLDATCQPEIRDGVLRYQTGSNAANTYAAMGRLMRQGDFRRAFAEGPSPEALKGPVLEEASYPEVLVALAISNGEDLSLVLHPGKADGVQPLGLARLVPGRRYVVEGAEQSQIIADDKGEARLDVRLSGRTPVSVRPA